MAARDAYTRRPPPTDGVEPLPIAFDDAIVMTPILYGEYIPLIRPAAFKEPKPGQPTDFTTDDESKGLA